MYLPDLCISRPAFLPKLGPCIVDPKSVWVILLQEEVLNVRILERSNAAFAKRKKESTDVDAGNSGDITEHGWLMRIYPLVN